MRISMAKAEEASILSKLDAQCFSDAWSEKDWKGFLSMEQYACLILNEEEQEKGFLLMSFAADEGEVIKIGVSPEDRGRHLAKELLTEGFHFWEQKEITSIFLEVRESNVPARKLYENHGFQEIGVRKNYYTNPKEHAIVYVKSMES